MTTRHDRERRAGLEQLYRRALAGDADAVRALELMREETTPAPAPVPRWEDRRAPDWLLWLLLFGGLAAAVLL